MPRAVLNKPLSTKGFFANFSYLSWISKSFFSRSSRPDILMSLPKVSLIFSASSRSFWAALAAASSVSVTPSIGGIALLIAPAISSVDDTIAEKLSAAFPASSPAAPSISSYPFLRLAASEREAFIRSVCPVHSYILALARAMYSSSFGIIAITVITPAASHWKAPVAPKTTLMSP